jgi:hypothetical protein
LPKPWDRGSALWLPLDSVPAPATGGGHWWKMDQKNWNSLCGEVVKCPQHEEVIDKEVRSLRHSRRVTPDAARMPGVRCGWSAAASELRQLPHLRGREVRARRRRGMPGRCRSQSGAIWQAPGRHDQIERNPSHLGYIGS